MSQSIFSAIVLAAGEGTRMKSALPKVLHEIAGRPMVAWPIESARTAGAERVVVVVGHGRDAVTAALTARFGGSVLTAVQEEQRGTGHAVKQALPSLAGAAGTVVILYGDCPLVPPSAIEALVRARPAGTQLAMLTMELADPTGYGRILRDASLRVVGVREHRDASDAERAIREVNPGMYAVDAAFLRAAIERLGAKNAAGELYLTDVVSMAAAEPGGVADVRWPAEDLAGINDRYQLALAEEAMQARLVRTLAESGVTVRDPRSITVGADVVVEPDAILERGVSLRGRTVVRAGARIDVGAVLDDVEVSSGAWVKPYTVAAKSRIGERAEVGPFAHLRADCDLGPASKIGNFVEGKNTRLGKGSKASHLAYLGDGVIGDDVNVGAGTIFCNYDGYEKHTTTLEDGSFIGSDSQIVAPIRVGKGAYVATGTTVTMDVPDDALAVGRARQVNKEGYAPRLRAQLAARKKKKG